MSVRDNSSSSLSTSFRYCFVINTLLVWLCKKVKCILRVMGYWNNSIKTEAPKISVYLNIRCTLIWQILDLPSIIIKIVCQALVTCHSVVLTFKSPYRESVAAVVWERYPEVIHYLLVSKVGNHARIPHRNPIQRCPLRILTGSPICRKGNFFPP